MNKSTTKPKADYQTLMNQGEKLLEKGKPRVAQSKFNIAARLKPNDPSPVAQLGWCQLAMHRYEVAKRQFKQALPMNTRHGESLYGLGYTYEKSGEKFEAEKLYKQYLSLYPKGRYSGMLNRKLNR